MKQSFFKYQSKTYMFIFIFISTPIFLYLTKAIVHDNSETINISAYLLTVLIGESLFIFVGLIKGLHEKVYVDKEVICLKRFGRTIQSINWLDVNKVYREQGKYETQIIFESIISKQKIAIPLTSLNTKNTNKIYAVCSELRIRQLIEEINI